MTILDIAKEAGVSKSTVSLVINGSDSVKMETRYKVEQAINKLGYVPNQAARQLITSRTHTIGLIFLTSNHFHKSYAFSSVPETLLYDASNGINMALQDTDYTLLTERFSSAGGDSVPYLIRSRKLDGVILIGGLFSDELMEQIEKQNLPVVNLGRQYKHFDSVAVDLEQAGFLGIDYLLEKGHRRIVFVNGPDTSSNSQKKLEGVRRALAVRGLPESVVSAIYTEYTGLGGYHSFRKLWETGQRPDAVFGGSDGITAGIMRYLYEQGVAIPDQVSILGYEDSILSEYASPALTCINTQKETMGAEACRVLMNRIKKRRAQLTMLKIAPTLIERNFVADRR